MSRLILLLIVAAIVVAVAAWIVAGVTNALIGDGSASEAPNRASGVQKVAYAALIVLMIGVATGWLGEA